MRQDAKYFASYDLSTRRCKGHFDTVVKMNHHLKCNYSSQPDDQSEFKSFYYFFFILEYNFCSLSSESLHCYCMLNNILAATQFRIILLLGSE